MPSPPAPVRRQPSAPRLSAPRRPQRALALTHTHDWPLAGRVRDAASLLCEYPDSQMRFRHHHCGCFELQVPFQHTLWGFHRPRPPLLPLRSHAQTCTSAHACALVHACPHRPVHTQTRDRASSEELLRVMVAQCGDGLQTLRPPAVLPACTCETRVRAQAGGSRTWVLPFGETCPLPQAVAESPKTCLLPRPQAPSLRDLVIGAQARTPGHACAGGWLHCGGWIEPGGCREARVPAPPSPRGWSRTPALPRLGAVPGHLLLVRGRGCAGPGTARRLSLEKPGPFRSLWSSGSGPVENKTSVSTSKLLEERGQGGTGGAVPAPRPQAVSQREVAVTSHHHTITLREGLRGPRRDGEGRQRSLEPRSQVRTGPGQWPPVHAAWPAGAAI